MFRIPHFYQNDDMSFQEAWDTMTRHGRGDCLEGMRAMDRMWSEYCASPDQDDDELFTTGSYEFMPTTSSMKECLNYLRRLCNGKINSCGNSNSNQRELRCS
jgi:hypothetical protein